MLNQEFSISNRGFLSDKFYGIITAIVTNVKDTEKLGRVEVNFEFSSNKKHNVTAWARISKLISGKEFGSSFIPTIESEVLITFIGGNVKNPCIIGMLSNGVDKPPKEAAEDSEMNIIQSEFGGALVFNNKEQILELKHEESKLKISLNAKTKIIEIENTEGEITITVGKDITIKTDANLNIEAKDIVLAGTGDLTITGNKIDIKATADLLLGGANIKSTATAQHDTAGKLVGINGSATTEIKGGVIKMN